MELPSTDQLYTATFHELQLMDWQLEVTSLAILFSLSLFLDSQENSVWPTKSHPSFWWPAARKHYSCQYFWLARPGKSRRRYLKHSSPSLFLLRNGQALSSTTNQVGSTAWLEEQWWCVGAGSILSVQCLQIGFALSRRCCGSCKALPPWVFFSLLQNTIPSG